MTKPGFHLDWKRKLHFQKQPNKRQSRAITFSKNMKRSEIKGRKWHATAERQFCSDIEARWRKKHKRKQHCKCTSKRRRQINVLQNECKYMQIPSISLYSVFLPNLWSFKTAGGQTASCLKFMKHLFNSPGRDLSWQPFTSPTHALLVWHPSGPRPWWFCKASLQLLTACRLSNTLR